MAKLVGLLNNRLYQLLFLAVVAGLCLYTMVYFAIIRPKLALLKKENNTTQQAKTNNTQPKASYPVNQKTTDSNNSQSSSAIPQNSNTQNNSSSVKNGCGNPYETSYSIKMQFDHNKLASSPDIATGGVKGKSVYCWENGALVDKVLTSPVDKIIISGTAISKAPTPTPSPTQPSISYADAYSLSANWCNAQGATINTSAYQLCILAKLKTYGY